ncbi:hypothetical protein ACIRSS_40980 [Amycolatopsis sp. NPDC101161]|uniref:hypothetical protein n=1 Tax=Amycolatopsis sp. NPDC101161 TaxID=3363940 RepID=UPI003828077C
MAGSAVPPTRLAERTRAAVREVLLAELRSASIRVLAAGCSRERLFEVLDARLSSLADEVGGRPAHRRSAAEAACEQPDSAAADGGRFASPRSAGEPGCAAPDSAGDWLAPVRWVAEDRPVHPSSAAEDREHRRDDPLQPGLVGEGGG